MAPATNCVEMLNAIAYAKFMDHSRRKKTRRDRIWATLYFAKSREVLAKQEDERVKFLKATGKP